MGLITFQRGFSYQIFCGRLNLLRHMLWVSLRNAYLTWREWKSLLESAKAVPFTNSTSEVPFGQMIWGITVCFFLYLLSLIVALILIVARTACWAELVTVTTWNYGEIWRTMKNLTPKIERIYWLVSVAQLRLFSFNMPINEVPSAEIECLKISALSKSVADTSSCFQAFL